MIFTYKELNEGPNACINGEFLPAKPLNESKKYKSLKDK